MLDVRESFDKDNGGESSVSNEDISNGAVNSPKVEIEELMTVDSIQKKLDYFETKFERIERAIFHITEYLTK